MWTLIVIELLKMKKTKIISISILVLLFIAILSLIQGWRIISLGFTIENDSVYFLEQLLFWNSYYVLPAVLVLIGSYSISREKQEGTLSQILMVPLAFFKLILAKLLVVIITAILFSIVIFLFGIVNQLVVFHHVVLSSKVLLMLGQYLINAFIGFSFLVVRKGSIIVES